MRRSSDTGNIGRHAVVVTGVAVLLLVAGCATPPPARRVSTVAAAVTTPPAPPGVRWPAAGALLGGPPDDPGDHYCSASVIDSPAGDLLVTAAHCVADGDGTPARTGMTFVPGYHDRTRPFGAWTVTAAFVDDTWRDHADPDHDVAFLTVTQEGGPPVQQVTGGYRLALDADAATPVDAIGYPDFADAPTVRSGVTSAYSPTQLQLAAHGLYDGTSGGPWLRAGTDVIGVTGGYEQGGLDPETSYAVHLGDAAGALLKQATAS